MKVSIPNGMEFYSFCISSLSLFWWVSIPNGMEFYAVNVCVFVTNRAFQFPTGWNSTLIADKLTCIFDAFQFPTGWNSTSRAALSALLAAGFNSQRDGILRSTALFGNGRWRFQFPTGWNSTNILGLKQRGWIVSIPNGMEFYCRNRAYTWLVMSFQFPTGWNSTVLVLSFVR